MQQISVANVIAIARLGSAGFRDVLAIEMWSLFRCFIPLYCEPDVRQVQNFYPIALRFHLK